MKKQKQILKTKSEIIKDIVEENKHSLEIYANYNDCFSDETIQKYLNSDLDEEDILYETTSDSYIDWFSEEIQNIISSNALDLEEANFTEDDIQELREALQEQENYDYSGILKNTSVQLRIVLKSEEDSMHIPTINSDDEKDKSLTFEEFKRVFKDAYDEELMQQEIDNNIGSEYADIVFYCTLSGEDIRRFKENMQKGKVTLSSGINFGLFNNWLGCGSLLDVELLKDIELNIKDWTNSNKDENYWNVRVLVDKENGYSINQTYGLCGSAFKELNVWEV